jgi:PAS domain S-box-containing protein
MSFEAKARAPMDLELLSAFLEYIPDHVYFKDLDSRFVRISRSLATHFGLSDPAQAVNRTDSDMFSSEHAEQALADEQVIIRTGRQVIGKEEKETWPDGREAWTSTTKVPLRNLEGQIIGTMGISRDITEHRRDELELQKYAEKTRAIQDLVRVMQEVTIKGDFVERVSIGGNDEIAQLGVQFNTMLRELHQHDLRKKDAEARLKYQAVTD